MRANTEKMQKITERGQITLPVSWRRKYKPDQILLEVDNDTIKISPLNVSKCSVPGEYTVFDAIRDNKGKGLKAKDLLNILKKID